MSPIQRIHAREVLDSRGKPTVECEVHLKGDASGRAIAPSGASTGSAEALELRDRDDARYDGDGVRQAVANVVHEIGPRLIGHDAAGQWAIDQTLRELDPSPQKTTLGGNAVLAVSLACAHAAAAAQRLPLYVHLARVARDVAQALGLPWQPQPRMPLPMVNMISGGRHAGGNLDFQDILIQPVGAADYATGLEWIVRVYRRLGDLLTAAGFEGRLVGDEGGYGPRLTSNRAAVEFVVRAIERAGLRPGEDVNLAIDVAATQFAAPGGYRLRTEHVAGTLRVPSATRKDSDGTRSVPTTGGELLTSNDMIAMLADWCDQFPIVSIEDGLAEHDWAGWQELTRRLGPRVRLVGDDLFATNPRLVRRGIDEGVANAALIKVNQIGTLSETLETMAIARSGGYACVVSARSGETEDTTIADLAVATAADAIKIGSIVRSERLAKYNQLLRIAEELAVR